MQCKRCNSADNFKEVMKGVIQCRNCRAVLYPSGEVRTLMKRKEFCFGCGTELKMELVLSGFSSTTGEPILCEVPDDCPNRPGFLGRIRDCGEHYPYEIL